MTMMCSRHQEAREGCVACHTHPRDVLPDYDAKVAEAEAAGTTMCELCGMVYYRTASICPLCSGRGPRCYACEVGDPLDTEGREHLLRGLCHFVAAADRLANGGTP